MSTETVAAAPVAATPAEPTAVAAPAAAEPTTAKAALPAETSKEPANPALPKLTFEGAKEKALAAIKAGETAAAKASAPPVAEPKAPETPKATLEIPVSPEMAKLVRQNRELAQKVAATEAAAKEAQVLREARELWKAGKKAEALGKVTDADPTEAMAEMLLAHLDTPQPKPEDAIAARIKELEAKITSKETAEAKAVSDAAALAAYESAKGYAVTVLDAVAAAHPISSRADNKLEAAAAALEKAATMAQEEGLTPADMTDVIKRDLMTRALGEVEKHYRTLGQRYALPDAQAPAPHSLSSANTAAPQSTPQTRPSQVRASVTVEPVRKVRTFEDAKQKALDALRASIAG